MSLEAIIRQRISEQGPLTVEDYMQLCLQHPQHGYYRKAQAVGAEGDFITAPEISQLMGDLLGMWLLDMAAQCQASYPGEPLHLAELGPGRGTLMADMMRIVSKQPAIAEWLSLHLLESNTTLKAQQAEALAAYAPQWHDQVEDLPQNGPLLIITNEFFDALPIRQWVGESERVVVVDSQGNLIFSPDGAVTKEACPQGGAIMALLAKRLEKQGGGLLVVDYGYGAGADHADSLQALLNHRYHDPLKNPGEADLTAHVDFAALAKAAQPSTVHISGPIGQGEFLQKLGGDLWLQKLIRLCKDDAERQKLANGWLRLISPAQMGSLFKVMAVTSPPLTPAGF
jgi:SAM-dependent MidA family methyltransferase